MKFWKTVLAFPASCSFLLFAPFLTCSWYSKVSAGNESQALCIQAANKGLNVFMPGDQLQIFDILLCTATQQEFRKNM